MFKCCFCSDLAVFECSENRFCIYHRPQHDDFHSGIHAFKDVFCQLSEKTHENFIEEIIRRLKTLKECKDAFTTATAEHIKSIQIMLSKKIAEIDKLSQFYRNFIQKEKFDKSDSEDIDKILSTRLGLKNLDNFTDIKFKEYIQQEIIESKELQQEKKNDFGLLSTEGKFLIDIIKYCCPKNIPERMLKGIMLRTYRENGSKQEMS